MAYRRLHHLKYHSEHLNGPRPDTPLLVCVIDILDGMSENQSCFGPQEHASKSVKAFADKQMSLLHPDLEEAYGCPIRPVARNKVLVVQA